MMNDEWSGVKGRSSSPWVMLVAGLTVALALTLMPGSVSKMMRGRLGDVLRPGQTGVAALRRHGDRAVEQVENHFESARRLSESEREREQLLEKNRRLETQLSRLRTRLARADADQRDPPGDPLLHADGIRARVLGQRARAFLGREHLLDVGAEAGVVPDALVIESRCALIDQGSDAGLETGQLVLGAGNVLGKIVETGSHTSTVRTMTEPGFRDLVRLGSPVPDGRSVRLGPRGILEGTGQSLARLQLIEVVEPVEVGDAVYSAAARGLPSEPLLYGYVDQVERPVGAPHWEIWVRPAVDPGRIDEVVVVGMKLNQTRVARRPE